MSQGQSHRSTQSSDGGYYVLYYAPTRVEYGRRCKKDDAQKGFQGGINRPLDHRITKDGRASERATPIGSRKRRKFMRGFLHDTCCRPYPPSLPPSPAQTFSSGGDCCSCYKVLHLARWGEYVGAALYSWILWRRRRAFFFRSAACRCVASRRATTASEKVRAFGRKRRVPSFVRSLCLNFINPL